MSRQTAIAVARVGYVADALALGRRIDLWSLGLAALALTGLARIACGAMPWPATLLLLVSVLAAGVQKSLALRVAFDEAVFRRWTESWRSAEADASVVAEVVLDDLQAFDRALAAAGLRRAAEGTTQDLDARSRGALRLLRWQLAVFAAQFALLLAAALATLAVSSG